MRSENLLPLSIFITINTVMLNDMGGGRGMQPVGEKSRNAPVGIAGGWAAGSQQPRERVADNVVRSFTGGGGVLNGT